MKRKTLELITWPKVRTVYHRLLSKGLVKGTLETGRGRHFIYRNQDISVGFECPIDAMKWLRDLENLHDG